MGSITLLLEKIHTGDTAAYNSLFELVEGQLYSIADRMMANERPDHSLQASGLVNEACIQLLKGKVCEKSPNRRFFFAAVNRAMGQILINHARRHGRTLEGVGERHPLSVVLDGCELKQGVTFSDMREALEQLGEQAPRLREIVELRVYAGLTIEEIATMLEISTRHVQRLWRLAKAVLHSILKD